MKTENRQSLWRLAEQYHIKFHGLDHPSPKHHEPIFSDIRKLGTYRFDAYATSITHDALDKPWRARTKQHASKVVHLAVDCRDTRQNEAGWRSALEDQIFARFSTEVVCKHCTSRLWRSEIEVSLEPPYNLEEHPGLATRQEIRKPCQCSDSQRMSDTDGPGICRIFHYRVDTAFKYLSNDPLHGLLPSRQKPDRVYGFRMTRLFDCLLKEKIGGQQLRDRLECSPFKDPDHPVLFPFLVHEAKSGTGDPFEDIETQTAFPIKKLLDLQQKLTIETGGKSHWNSGPLVWFLSHHGYDWRVAAAYITKHGDGHQYHITRLWSGDITQKDDALQLLLIIDYIFDWARDAQRDAILGQLRLLAGRSVASISADSEIRSQLEYKMSMLDPDFEPSLRESWPDSAQPDPQQNDPYRQYNSTRCVVRSARRAYARMSGLYISGENLSLLMRSFDTPKVAEKFAGAVLDVLADAFIVTPSGLQKLEHMWANPPDLNLDNCCRSERFYAVFTVAAYMTSDWQQVSELTYIAIAQGALENLKAYANPYRPRHLDFSGPPRVEEDTLVGFFRHFRQSSARFRLHAAMRRSCLSSRVVNIKDHQDDLFLVAKEDVGQDARYHVSVAMLKDNNPKTRQLFAEIYKKCKIGTRPTEESFLRVSSTYDETTDHTKDLPFIWDAEKSAVHETSSYILLKHSEGSRGGHPNYCVYVMDNVPGPPSFSLKLGPGERSLAIVRHQYSDMTTSKTKWNSVPLAQFEQADSDMMQQLKTQFQNKHIPFDAGMPVAATVRSSGSLHAPMEQPGPYLHDNVASSPGFQVPTEGPIRTTFDTRVAPNYIVGLKHNAKQFTYLYSNNVDAGPIGLGHFTHPENPRRTDISDELRREGNRLREAIIEPWKTPLMETLYKPIQISKLVRNEAEERTVRLNKVMTSTANRECLASDGCYQKLLAEAAAEDEAQLQRALQASRESLRSEPVTRPSRRMSTFEPSRKRRREEVVAGPSDVIEISDDETVPDLRSQRRRTDEFESDWLSDEKLQALLEAGKFCGTPAEDYFDSEPVQPPSIAVNDSA